jgi:hypothetical protein
MGTHEGGFQTAWELLLLDFEEVLVGNGATDPGGHAGTLAYPVFDRPFSIVKLFNHRSGEMGLELRADGYSVVLSIIRQEAWDDETENDTGIGTEIGNVQVNYDELLDTPDQVMARVLSLLPRD